MKQYLLFGGKRFYPLGGWDDFIADFHRLEEAIKYVVNNPDKICPRNEEGWYHIIDSFNNKKVQEGTIK